MNGAANIGNVANRIAMAIMAAGLAWCLFGFIAPGSAQSAPDSTAAATDGVTIVANTGIDHLGVWILAKRAMHVVQNRLSP